MRALCGCTKDVNYAMLVSLLGDLYDSWQLFPDLEDSGHAGSSRKRTYIIFALRGSYTMLANPVALYDQVSNVLKSQYRTCPSDYLTANNMEMLLEAAEVCRVRRLPFRPNSKDWSYMLTERERSNIATMDAEYQRRWLQEPSSIPDLCYYLVDNPAWSFTWSASSNKIPALRRNNGKVWFPSKRRWMTSGEKPRVSI